MNKRRGRVRCVWVSACVMLTCYSRRPIESAAAAASKVRSSTDMRTAIRHAKHFFFFYGTAKESHRIGGSTSQCCVTARTWKWGRRWAHVVNVFFVVVCSTLPAAASRAALSFHTAADDHKRSWIPTRWENGYRLILKKKSLRATIGAKKCL